MPKDCSRVIKQSTVTMQSGISGKSPFSELLKHLTLTTPASAELHEAFNSFLADPSLFCLPVTITDEQLTPLSPLSFANDASNDDSAFFSSLPTLSSILQPKTPVYLLLRRAPTLIALTYVPSNSPVRSKTLFASTRATLVRELGSEKFGETVFAVEEGEVVKEAEWRERDADKANGKGNAGGEAEEERRRVEVMGEQERELYLLKKAEAEVRSMSHRRDIGIGGDSGKVGKKQMPIGEGVKEAWGEVKDEEGKVVVVVSLCLRLFAYRDGYEGCIAGYMLTTFDGDHRCAN